MYDLAGLRVRRNLSLALEALDGVFFQRTPGTYRRDPDLIQQWQLQHPRQPDHSFYRRRRHRPRHLEGFGAGVRCGGGEGYGGKRRVAWYEVFAGEKAMAQFKTWLPDETVDAIREFARRHQGPADDAGGRRHSLAERRAAADLDLYACVRPVKYYQGVPRPVKHPERMDIVIFRENTEDVYAGIEWKQGTPEAKKLIDFINNEMLKGGKKKVRQDSGVGIKPISITGTKRLVRMAIQYALEQRPQDGDAGAQGQHPEVHRRRVPRVGLRGGDEEFRDQIVTERESWILGNLDKNPGLTVEAECRAD